MKTDALNNLKAGEQLVEMQEYTLHGMNVIEVTLYKCVSIFGFRKIKTYTFPFYFTSKELVENFLKFCNYFEISKEPLRWCDNTFCISLVVKGQTRKYHMVDEYKIDYYKKDYIFKPCALEEKGIWNGKLNDTDDLYVSDMDQCYNFMELLDRCNIPLKSEKTYMFKMIEEK